jgi:signal transduction histidine kinase
MSVLSPEAALQALKPSEPIFHRQHGMIRGALEERTGDTGTGLGLATVHEMVRDGAMNVHSESGRGSGFEAWLPAGQQTPLP